MSKNKEVTAAQMNAIRKIITEQMGLKLGHPICSTASLEHSLKIDGLDMDEIVMEMEEEFEIEISNHVIKKWNIVSDIEQFIANKVPKDYGSSFRVAQPKKVAVKMSKEIGEPVKFKNSRPHNLSLIMGDLEKKLAPTKATEGFDMTITAGTVYCMHGAAEVARAVVEISEGFNGFRLYVGNVLVIEHNVGSESHILALCDLARLAGAAMPKSLDDWLVMVIVRYVACVKKSLRYMHHLLNEKDTTQQLFKIQSTFELEISPRVFDLYEREYMVSTKKADVLRVFNEMLESAHGRKSGGCYVTGVSFREGDGEDDHEEEEPDSFADTIDADEEDEMVDLLVNVSTPGLVAIFNHISNEGMGDFDDSLVYELSGIKRRIEIIHELCRFLSMKVLVEYALATDLKSGDAAMFAGR